MRSFLDRVTLFLKSGKGGDGISSLRREKFVRKGGPDGGDGGKGGDVIFRVNHSLYSLNHLRYKHHFKAEDGENGMSSKKHGKSGKDVIIEVPPGTVVLNEYGEEILDMLDGDYVFLKGGKGGLGNIHFKSSINRTPRRSTKGKQGEEEKIILELRLIADIGLVGKPNAGKSTFLKVLTDANVEIASYPFTTKEVNIGILSNDIHKASIADIPGIIEGASNGKGMGLKFLKHISRVKLLLFIIDITDNNPVLTLNQLINEIKEFNPKLLRKKKLVFFNKTDLLEDKFIINDTFNIPYDMGSLKMNEIGNIKEKIFHELYND